MARVEIKKRSITTRCACKSHNAKYHILVKGISATPQAELPLCDKCFNELKEKIKAF